MIYDPNKELTDEQLTQLSEDDFLEYLDTKAEYLKQFSKPLPGYYLKRYAYTAAKVEGRDISDKEHNSLNKMSKEYNEKRNEWVLEKLQKDLEKDNGRTS
jgi:hypothetical protein